MQPKIIENFISKETSQTLHNFLKTKSYEHLPDIPHPAGIMHTSIDEKYLKSISEEKDLFIIDLINLLINSISNVFNLPKDKLKIKTQRYTWLSDGQSLSKHDDYLVSNYKVYSAVLYLTDDYEGGEILFYNEDKSFVSYKPSAGSLIYFEGNLDYPHEVKEVISGDRANLVLFYESSETKPSLEDLANIRA